MYRTGAMNERDPDLTEKPGIRSGFSLQSFTQAGVHSRKAQKLREAAPLTCETEPEYRLGVCGIPACGRDPTDDGLGCVAP
jgi:hypothetical protein